DRPDRRHRRGGAGGGQCVRRIPRHATHARDVQEKRTEGQACGGGHPAGRESMNFISMNLVTLMYLIASVCFIQALKGLSSPGTARTGNAFGMSGMAIAAVTTVALILKLKAEATAAGAG